MEKKDVKSEEIDELTKMMKEMKIQLMKSFNRGNSYEKRDRGYNNNNRREIQSTLYNCTPLGTGSLGTGYKRAFREGVHL